ncbi:MAG: phosphatidate cytidylyltransferase [SAR324 cluster bacterium]|nr:phosphatidate cytidylyltransferase [SAR324 cluster bacterium]
MPKELQLRIASAFFLVLLGIAYLFYTSYYVFIGVSCLMGLIGHFEFGRAGLKKGLPLFQPTLYLNHILLFGYFFGQANAQGLGWPAEQVTIILGLLGASLLLTPLVLKQNVIESLKWNLFGLVWITIPFYAFVWLRFDFDQGHYLILYVISLAAMSDIFAYFGGKKFGKHKLAPSISPGKTREGSAIGLACATLFGVYFGLQLLPDMSVMLLGAMVVVLVIISQAGDLVESKFKRFCGVKDSGTILPGHGGLLDRFDAYLTSLPLFWAILYFIGL